MKFTRKRIFIGFGVILLLLGFFFGGHDLFLYATRGNVSVVDGVRQNSRIYITDAYYESGFLYYTVVNDSSKRVSVADYLVVERREDGIWECAVTTQKVIVDDENFCRIDRFSQFAFRTAAEDIWDKVLPGEYRLLVNGAARISTRVTAEGTKERYVKYPDKGYCIVGYFTITEEMLAASAS